MPEVCSPIASVLSSERRSLARRPTWYAKLKNDASCLIGPANNPPTEMLLYCWPSDRAARSVHCSCGASTFRLIVRVMKLEPGRPRIWNCAPLNPPRETSYGVVTSDVETLASRGRFD